MIGAATRVALQDLESGVLARLAGGPRDDLAGQATLLRQQGSYSAASGVMGDSTATNLQVTLNLPQPGVVRFWYKVSSEVNYDYLRFYVDNVLQGGWSGTVPWAQASYNVGAGQHVFRWTYSKDVSLASGSDKAWIDEVYVGP